MTSVSSTTSSKSTTSADRPAILGGTPAVTADQTQANKWPIITEEDEQAVLEVLRSGQLSINPIVNELEEDYRSWLGMEFAVAHNNGTGALHTAMHALELRPGDEVLVPSATWWASVMPILHQGGIPVFVETEPKTLGLDPADLQRKITDRTRAMVVVHLFGMPSLMDELQQIAGKHNLRIIEDASHAHGARYHGKPIGTFGDIAVFSMQANKLCPSAEGGMALTHDRELFERIVRYGHYERLLPMKESPNRYFAATGFGHKYRMSPLSAAVARTQLRHLPERNQQRNENCMYLSERLEELGFETFLPPKDVERVYFEFLVRFDDTDMPAKVTDIAKALQAEGAQVGAPRYPLLHQQPMFTQGVWASIARLNDEIAGQPLPKYDPMDLPRTIAGNAQLIKLPSFPRASRELLDQYATAFAKVIQHLDQLPREAA